MLSVVRTVWFVPFCALSALGSIVAATNGQQTERLETAGFLANRFRPSYYSAGTDPGSILLVDLNRDGHLDLVTGARTDSGQPAVRVRRGNSDGTFGPRTDFSALSFPTSIASGDFNQDGWPDLLVGYDSGNGSASRFMNTTSTAGGPVQLTTPRTDFGASLTESVAVADLDHDGNDDLVVARSFNGNVAVFWGLGQGAFSGAQSIPPAASYRMVVSDIDGDGNRDIIAVGRSGIVGISRNLGNRHFDQLDSLDVGGNARDSRYLAIGEINGDGHADIVTSNYADGSVTVFETLGASLNFRTGVTYPVAPGSEPTGIALSDLTGDGLDEIVVARENGEYLTILENTKHGEFAGGIDVIVERQPMTVTIVDADANGCPDIFVGSGQVGSDRGGVDVLRDLLCDPNTRCQADFNHDGFVNTQDLVLFLFQFGRTCP